MDPNEWEEVKDVFEGWRDYPSNVAPEPAAVNLQSYRDRISDLRTSYDKVDVRTANAYCSWVLTVLIDHCTVKTL